MNKTELMDKLKRIAAQQTEKKAKQQEAVKAFIQRARAAAEKAKQDK